MSEANERHERYADAIWESGREIPWSYAQRAAEGAMAMADAEIAETAERAALWERRYRSGAETYRDVSAEVARLNRELEVTQRALRFETVQLAAEKAHTAGLRVQLDEASEANERLAGELESAEDAAHGLRGKVRRLQVANTILSTAIAGLTQEGTTP